ncbi:acetate--CoA ligase family protein [Roseovarius sp. A21]|uniref:Acetate--CoA ligase family protein n=1 Tax=Roseovarius bejariae TaxID=2576383 RepID=A0A844CYM0_9RHOB|nr:acetate--CoA ligase family protein [Roseovarius bejariae]MRU14733.1 acetate--CoA ligase family protein [Roseovarius bejariae]
MRHPLDRLLRPKSIAVIGGGAWCSSVIEQCRKIGFAGEIWPVHPKRNKVGGVAAFARLEDLPQAPDASFIGVNRHATIETVRLLREKEAGGAVCFASGFREAQAETGDGEGLQAALLEAAGEMPIIGPNCYGVINYLDRALLWPDQHGGVPVDRGVAILTQSSNIAINLTMQARGLPLAYVLTAGNQAQQGLAELGLAVLADERVTALGLHIEGVGDLRAFERLAAEAKRLAKPIVAIKAGRSDQARAAAVSHTASLTGSDTGARALLARLGIAQVESLPALLETLKLIHFNGALSSNKVVSLSCSGGEASLMADTAEGHDVVFPSLTPAQTTRLREVLGPMVALANPLDYHTFIWDDVPKMADCFSAALDGDAAIGCLIVDYPRADRCDRAAWECTIEAGALAVKATGKPLIIVTTLPEALPEDVTARITSAGMIPMHGLDDTLGAISRAAWLGQQSDSLTPVTRPGAPCNLVTISEAEAKMVLQSKGLQVPESIRAERAAALADCLAHVSGPAVIKAEGLAHKTEAGGIVFVGEDTAQAIETASKMPCQSWLVEERIEDAVAELLVGILRDPAHGFVLTIGAGGTWTELLRDSTSLLCPVTGDDIRNALTNLKIYPLLTGYRGASAANVDAIVRAVLAIQNYVVDHAGEIEEVEVNPLLICPTRAVAVDALIRKGEAR